MYHNNVPNIPILLTTILFGLFQQNLDGCSWFLETYLQSYDVKEVCVLEEDGASTVGSREEGIVKNVSKGSRMGKTGGETRILKWRGHVG